MSMDLLIALERLQGRMEHQAPHDFTSQHKVWHDFESLIWVVVYAMMIQRRNTLAVTDPTAYIQYKEHLDGFWGVHSYTKLVNCHEALLGAGIVRLRTIVEELWFPDPVEAEFFRAAMRLVRSQVHDEEPITYEKMQDLFRTYIEKGEQTNISTQASA